MPISVSSGHFALRYEVPKFLARDPEQGVASLLRRGVYRYSTAREIATAVARISAASKEAFLPSKVKIHAYK